MNRKLLVPSLAFAAAALLGGCATGYEYRQGTGDYYYGQPSVDYDDDGYYGGHGYGVPYGGYGSGWGLGFGYGFGYPYWGGYPFYGYPYYYRHHRRHHDPHQGPDPRVGSTRPPLRPQDPDGIRHHPPMVPEPAIQGPGSSAPPVSARPWTPMPQPPRMVREPRVAPTPRALTAPRFEPPARSREERDERRNSKH